MRSIILLLGLFSSAASQGYVRPTGVRPYESNEGTAEVEEQFAQLDLNSDGFMTSDEMLMLGMPMELWAEMLAHYDAGDLDGKISLDEILQADGLAPANLLMDRIGAHLAEHKKQVRAARLRLLAGPL